MTKKLGKSFFFTFNTNILSVQIGSDKDMLALEFHQEKDEKQVFRFIDLHDSKMEPLELTLAEKGLLQLVYLYKDWAIFYRYSNLQNPTADEILCLNILQKRIAWRASEVKFNSGCQSIIEVQREGALAYFDLINQKDVNKSEFRMISDSTIAQEIPNRYLERGQHFKTVGEFLKKIVDVEAVKVCDYLESNNSIIISYYIYDGDRLTNYLLVCDSDGKEILLHECIFGGREKVSNERFFVVGDQLIFIKNENEIRGYVFSEE